MEKINLEETGGTIGFKRVLGTFTLVTQENGRISVFDDWNNNRWVGGGYIDVAAAVKAFKYRDDARLI